MQKLNTTQLTEKKGDQAFQIETKMHVLKKKRKPWAPKRTHDRELHSKSAKAAPDLVGEALRLPTQLVSQPVPLVLNCAV